MEAESVYPEALGLTGAQVVGGRSPPELPGGGLRPSLKGSTALGPELSWTTGSRQGTAGEKLGSRARG